MSCSKGCTNSCSCENEKTFSSLVNYDGAKIPCIDVKGAIKPPFTNLNVVIELIAAKVCELIALGGVPGPAGTNGTNGTNGTDFSYQTIPGISALLSGSASATSSVTSITAYAMKNGKYHTVNYNVALLVTGNIGEGLVLDIDLTTYLTNSINNHYFNSIYFEPLNFTILPKTRYMTAASGQKKLVSSSYLLDDVHLNTVINVYGQISFYEF